MYTQNIQIRVRYSETDQMGYVYYGNYAQYFEVARVEMLRNLGIHYRKLEDDGIMLPVLEYSIKYYKPAFYDDLLTVETSIEALPEARIYFSYKTLNEAGLVLNEAKTTLVFVSIHDKRPCRAPLSLQDKLKPYFSA